MVYRCHVEKRAGMDAGSESLLHTLREDLKIDSVNAVRIINRYDVEGVDHGQFEELCARVFSDPRGDILHGETFPAVSGPHRTLCVESIPGQFDQRADSAAYCASLLLECARPAVRASFVYIFMGEVSAPDFEKIRGYIINSVENREATGEVPETLALNFPEPDDIPTAEGLIDADENKLGEIHRELSLAMDTSDLAFMQEYFKKEGRDPTMTEIRMLDAYWSDHCRHSTFHTIIDSVEFEDLRVERAYNEYRDYRREIYGDEEAFRPVTLMDVATTAMKALKKRGGLRNIDLSEEINACSIKIKATVNGEQEDWLLMFKNETHNHPTEIEPYGGASTCLGGGIRDPLSGRAYVYQAMRITGAGDPRTPFEETLPNKLPQKKITTTAAAGYSAYGNQIGLTSGFLQEIYHPGYVAKRMELGALVAAARAGDVVRKTPEPGDAILLIGGRTGRDGCGGATSSSKTHTSSSMTECAAEVQKGNPIEERKIVRLFRKPEVARMIKRCNDFGAGGVSVAIGELADGISVNLDAVPAKYEGMNGTELAISESQERMAVVISDADLGKFMDACDFEGLECTVVARVTEEPRLRMSWRGKEIVNISREFINTSGVTKHMRCVVGAPNIPMDSAITGDFKTALYEMLSDINTASQRALAEGFDSSVNAGSVLSPFGGKYQATPAQAMAALIPVESGVSETASVMAFGYEPYSFERDVFGGAREAVLASVAKVVAAGADYADAYLTFQEYFESLRGNPARWGKPLAALLGALEVQMGLNIAAIGGKDSMSGSFDELDVPPALVSFAVAPVEAKHILSPEFKRGGNPVYLFAADSKADKLDYGAIGGMFKKFTTLAREGKIRAAAAITSPGERGIWEIICKMAFGNGIGFSALEFDASAAGIGSIIAETSAEVPGAVLLGYTNGDETITRGDTSLPLGEARAVWEAPLEKVFPSKAENPAVPAVKADYRSRPAYASAVKLAKPVVLMPVFPGTSGEYDTAKAIESAGGEVRTLVIRSFTPEYIREAEIALRKAIGEANIVVLTGGSAGGDQPDGAAKYIDVFMRHAGVAEAVRELLYKRDGLMLGIGNGFQALVKLGLLPFGNITEPVEGAPILAMNSLMRAQCRYVDTRVASLNSPWMSSFKVGDIYTLPVAAAENRLVCAPELLKRLAANGQIATQYVDFDGVPSMDAEFNPSLSDGAVEGLFSTDGRVFGRMAHFERAGELVAVNIAGEKIAPVFEGGIGYYK